MLRGKSMYIPAGMPVIEGANKFPRGNIVCRKDSTDVRRILDTSCKFALPYSMSVQSLTFRQKLSRSVYYGNVHTRRLEMFPSLID